MEREMGGGGANGHWQVIWAHSPRSRSLTQNHLHYARRACCHFRYIRVAVTTAVPTVTQRQSRKKYHLLKNNTMSTWVIRPIKMVISETPCWDSLGSGPSARAKIFRAEWLPVTPEGPVSKQPLWGAWLTQRVHPSDGGPGTCLSGSWAYHQLVNTLVTIELHKDPILSLRF